MILVFSHKLNTIYERPTHEVPNMFVHINFRYEEKALILWAIG